MLSLKTNATAGIAPGPMGENPGTAGDGSNPALEHAMDNTVTIVVETGGEMKTRGTGFFVAGTDGMTVVTADHVVDDFAGISGILRHAAGDKLYIRPCGGDQAGELLEVKVGARDTDNDLAVVRLESPTDYSGIVIAPDGSATLGEGVWILGTPRGLRCSVMKAYVSTMDSPEKSELQLHVATHGGESGGAVIDNDGRLVGVLVSGNVAYLDADGDGEPDDVDGDGKPDFWVDYTISYATKSEEVKELVERYQAIRENSMASESAEDGFSASLFNVDELPDIDDVEGMEPFEIGPDNPDFWRGREGLELDLNDPQVLKLIEIVRGGQTPPPADNDPRLIESVVDFVRGLAVGNAKLAVGNALADQLAGPVGTNELPGTGGPIGGGGSEAAELDVPDLDVPLPG